MVWQKTAGESAMIDLERARKRFKEYLKDYDVEDDKIKLKLVHTFCVLDAADEICRGEGFSEEDRQLAVLISLLHDIGRFEQLKLFHSFDDTKMNHADFGVKILFQDGLIEEFIEERQFDAIISKAIQYHSLYALPDDLPPREALHCKIIRDADKLDNFRVKNTERLETIFDAPREAVSTECITHRVLERIRAHQCIKASERDTHLDFWVSFLAFIFDLNFKTSFRWILRHDYLNRNMDRIDCGNPQTKRDMEEIREICGEYLLSLAADVYAVYFSPTGGTKKVTEALAGVFGTAKPLDLSLPEEDYGTYTFRPEDICVIGVPAFGGRVPAVALERLNKMHGGGARAVLAAVYGNRAYDDTLAELAETSVECGFIVTAAVAALAEHSIITEFAAERPDEKDMEELRQFAVLIKEKMASREAFQGPVLHSGRSYREYKGIPLKPTAGKQCSRCGLCAKMCPVLAIPPENPAAVDSAVCISCMRCVKICPEHARRLSQERLLGIYGKLKKVCEGRKENELFL